MGGIVVYHFRRTRARYLLSILAPLTLLSWYVSYRYPSPAFERVLRHPDADTLQVEQGAYGDIAMGHEEAQRNELWDASFSWPSHKRSSKNEKAINASGGGWMTSSEIRHQYSDFPSASISPKLALLLRKIEDQELIKRQELVKNLVMVVEAKTRRVGPPISRSRDLQLYDLLAQSLGLRRHVLIGSEGVEKAFDRLEKHGNSSILLCDPETFRVCRSKWIQRKLEVNVIPSIHERLTSPVQLCHAQRNLNHLQKPCFVLPDHLDDFLTAAEILPPSSSEWLVQEDNESKILLTSELYELIRNKVYSVNHPVVVRHYINPLSLGDKPVQYVQILTTVTSWRPLRTHQYHDGFIIMRENCTTKSCQTSSQTTLPLAMLHEMQNMIRNAAARLLTPLLVATENESAGIQTCSNCFQLLAMDLMVQANCQNMEVVALRAFPTSHFNKGHQHGNAVNNKNLMSRAESSLFYQRWMIDSLKLIMNRETVSEAVQRPLEHVIANLNLGIVGLNSQVDHDLALTEPDLAYLIHTYQEWKASPKYHFHSTYPSTEPATLSLPSFKRFLLPLQHWESYRHATTDLHKILTSFARQMIQLERENEPHQDKLGSNSSLHYNVVSCEFVLYGLEFDYDLALSPSFRPDWFEYHGQVPYHVEKLQIRVIQLEPGVPRRQILLDDDIDLTGGSAAVISLGLGLNCCRLKVLSSRVANWTYSLRITRQDRILSTVREKSHYSGTSAYAMYPTCALFQNCNVRFAPDQPCGLYPLASTTSPGSNWSAATQGWSNLPLCTTGDAPGRWVLPCQDCANSSTCHWELQRWQPLGCQYPRNTLNTRQLQSCVANRKVLFLGDSTNRGMMHQFLERLNGTLTNGDKIHDIRHYRAATPAAWHVAFAYYPQFWWPATQRPSFEQLLHQLFLAAGPLENNTNTVLVAGGVQWMAASHVSFIRRLLIREGLEGIQVIIKTLGSGFHLPVNGVHRLTQEQVPKLYQQSLKLAHEAKKAGMGVVDTFVMTVSRSQDFLPGRCACHFHQVINTTPIQRTKKIWQSVDDEETHPYETFHVKGAINALYTEILISELCGQTR